MFPGSQNPAYGFRFMIPPWKRFLPSFLPPFIHQGRDSIMDSFCFVLSDGEFSPRILLTQSLPTPSLSVRLLPSPFLRHGFLLHCLFLPPRPRTRFLALLLPSPRPRPFISAQSARQSPIVIHPHPLHPHPVHKSIYRLAGSPGPCRFLLRVENLIAFALLFLRMDRFAMVISTSAASSFRLFSVWPSSHPD